MSDENQHKVLIVEDDPGLQTQLKWCFSEDISVFTAQDEASAIEVLRREEPQVITLDLGLPPDPGGASVGFKILDRVLTLAPSCKVIVITGREDHENAISAIAKGAYDFYHKPIDQDTLQFVTDRAFRLHDLESENRKLIQQKRRSPLSGMVASCEQMIQVARTVEKIAPTDITTLILGETGTGKELIAKALHELSGRVDAPFSAINCAAIPETLLESELFGYEKGAFTGATSQRKGKIESSDKGTLFLDEIGDMPLALQAKLLRFLQERVVERLGGRETIPVDVRVVCATHRDLEGMIEEGTFREDLYYRVGELKLTVPPLRDRDDDIVLIAQSLLTKFSAEYGKANLNLSNESATAILQYGWPGNVRELENRVKRATIMAESSTIHPEDLELPYDGGPESELPLNLRAAREAAEEQIINKALGITQNNVASAARLLGVTRPTLYNLLSKYGIKSPV